MDKCLFEIKKKKCFHSRTRPRNKQGVLLLDRSFLSLAWLQNSSRYDGLVKFHPQIINQCRSNVVRMQTLFLFGTAWPLGAPQDFENKTVMTALSCAQRSSPNRQTAPGRHRINLLPCQPQLGNLATPYGGADWFSHSSERGSYWRISLLR